MLAKHMEIIVNAITRKINPVSIYLIGSFGRGEGAVILHNGKIIPLRDYDILVISLKPVAHQTLYNIKKEIEKEIDIPIIRFSNFDSSPFEVWITQLTVQEMQSLPILKIMDVKYSARLLWGKDLRGIIEVEPNEISIYNVFMVLSGFLTGIIYDLDLWILKSHGFSWKRFNLIYQCLKINIEIPTVFLLLKGFYAPSFGERVNLFSEIYESQFDLISSVKPDLAKRVRAAFEARKTLTEGKFDKDGTSLPDLLRQVVEDIKLTLEYFIVEKLGKRLGTKSLSDWLFENAKWILPFLLSDLFQKYLARKRINTPQSVTRLISNIYLLRSSLKVYHFAHKIGLPVKINVIVRPGLLLELYAISLDVIETAISSDRNNEHMAKAIEKISKIIDLKKLDISVSNETSSLDDLVDVTRLLIKIADGVVHNKDLFQQLGASLKTD